MKLPIAATEAMKRMPPMNTRTSGPDTRSISRYFLRGLVALVFAGLLSGTNRAASAPVCRQQASTDCYETFHPAHGAGQLHYYTSQRPQAADDNHPRKVLIVVHGHPRDANITFNAALAALNSTSAPADTVVIAPVFQVGADEAGRCSTAGVPLAQADDLRWTCASWIDGSEAADAPGMTSFAAMDALVKEVLKQWPSAREVTIAGFSAGAQMVQHYIGFADPDISRSVAIRYVVADPGSWLYFDAVRPSNAMDGQTMDTQTCNRAACPFQRVTDDTTCPDINRWKYGTESLPDSLRRDAATARAQYANASVFYLEAAQDSGTGHGTYSRILDKSCAAMAQGTFRLQRGLAYAAYDRQWLARDRPRAVTVIPGCAHDVTCVFSALAARDALLGSSR
jgi:predicted esterase